MLRKVQGVAKYVVIRTGTAYDGNIFDEAEAKGLLED